MTTEKFTDANRPKINKVEVYWHTVTYRTVLLYIAAFLILFAAAGYLVFPDSFAGLIRHVSKVLQPKDTGASAANMRGARFVNLDGKVEVKRVNSVQWTTADYSLTLDKGDLIQ